MPEIIYGRHAVYHLLASGRRMAYRLHLQRGLEKGESQLLELARSRNLPVQFEGPSFFQKKIGPQATHQGIALETEGYPYVAVEELFSESLVLILDGIQDPQNLGALCRSAYLFGVEGVVIPETHAASIGPGACQASVGAVEYLKIARISSISNSLELFKKEDFWVYGADPSGEKLLQDESFSGKVAVVIGAEEKGLRRLVRERCDVLLRIPTLTRGIDSLNASVSGGVFLYEVVRQRWAKNRVKTTENP